MLFLATFGPPDPLKALQQRLRPISHPGGQPPTHPSHPATPATHRLPPQPPTACPPATPISSSPNQMFPVAFSFLIWARRVSISGAGDLGGRRPPGRLLRCASWWILVCFLVVVDAFWCVSDRLWCILVGLVVAVFLVGC